MKSKAMPPAAQLPVEAPIHNKERRPGSPGWGLGVGLTFLPSKNSTVSKLRQQGGQGPKRTEAPDEEEEN